MAAFDAENKPLKYRFADFTLDRERASLTRLGVEIKLRPKVYDALAYLIQNKGRIVPKKELIHALWPDAFVTDDSLVQCMVELRRALDDRSQELLKTVPRRGYIFAADVAPCSVSPDASPEERRIALDHSLPIARTPLIGREEELEAIERLLTDPALRLLTLTGSGGSGKTRLAVEVAGKLNGFFRGGVHFIGLGSVSDAAMVPAAIAESLNIREVGGRSLENLLREYFRDSSDQPVLLLLDNLEHILAASGLVVELIEASRTLTVLVTSRSPLRVYGEHEFPVRPLALPDSIRLQSFEALKANPAVLLFAQRAAAVKPDFKLDPDNAGVVAEICERVDGLPLAIELAAARIKMLPPVRLLARLESRLGLLTTGARDLPERQQTLRNAIDWSYDLLTEAEQKLLRRLAVFWDGCTLEGAEAVANTAYDLGPDLLDLMSSLVDKSLIQQRQRGSEEPRFHMLETIREYAIERLRESGEQAPTKRAHSAYCLVLAEEGNPDLNDVERAAWLTRCEMEHDDFRAALDWLFQTRDLEWAFRLCTALFRFWDMREHLTEGRDRLETVLSLAGNEFPRERAKVSQFLGALYTSLGDFSAAERYLAQGLSIYRELDDYLGIAVSLNALGVNLRDIGDYVGAQKNFDESLACWRKVNDRAATARCLHNLANVAKIRGEYDQARAALFEAMEIFREINDRSGAAWSVNQQGDVARERGDISGARVLYEQALAAFRHIGDYWGTARSLADLGSIACELGDHDSAHEAYRESLEIFTRLEHRRGIARVLEGLACAALAAGDTRRALCIAASAAHLREVISAPLTPAEQLNLDQRLRSAWKDLSDSEAKRAWDEGWAMLLPSAIRYSLESVPAAGA
ncbi:MAG TPA: tetratricopeptide repeat protein [Candidatus Sulfotelmatobacter sp.]|nr:tetratricopeptide repeat protein [Candidatus Sulfotelmatobacter sp.]